MLHTLEPNDEVFKDEIIEKGPPKIKYVFGKPKQKDHLPKKPFKTYDSNGYNCKLYFETDGIFTLYKEIDTNLQIPQNERIFYHEIKYLKFVPTKNFENYYNNIFLRTKFGIRIFYFIPSEYKTMIRKIINGI